MPGPDAENTTQVESSDQKIARLEAENARLKTENSAKDTRITQLEAGKVDLEVRLKVAEEKSEIDTLTEIPNRRGFDRNLREMLALARRNGLTMVVIIFDLDHFKEVNDNNDHQHGDEILKLFAGAINLTKRETDFIGRFGGEEFGGILPVADETTVQEIDEMLLRYQAAVNLINRNSPNREFEKLTVSMGAVIVDGSKTVFTDKEVVRQADLNVYKAKDAGRRRSITTLFASAANT